MKCPGDFDHLHGHGVVGINKNWPCNMEIYGDEPGSCGRNPLATSQPNCTNDSVCVIACFRCFHGSKVGISCPKEQGETRLKMSFPTQVVEFPRRALIIKNQNQCREIFL